MYPPFSPPYSFLILTLSCFLSSVAVTKEEVDDQEEYTEIMEDMRDEGGEYDIFLLSLSFLLTLLPSSLLTQVNSGLWSGWISREVRISTSSFSLSVPVPQNGIHTIP